MLPIDQLARLNQIIELSWVILFERIISGKLIINKESSLQLHFSKLIYELGNCYCILPHEIFEIEMETKYEKKSIDIVCSLGQIRAAVELKCFRKSSNRATDLDCYDALVDVERLHSFTGFNIKKFICLTDNKYYPEKNVTGYGNSVMLKHGTVYLAETPIIPGWTGKWKVGRDRSIVFPNDVICNWVSKENWHYWMADINS